MAVILAVYNINVNASTYTVAPVMASTPFQTNDAIHPLCSTFANANTSSANILQVPIGLTYGQMVRIYGFTTINVNGNEYVFELPEFSLVPSNYTVNSSIGNTQIQGGDVIYGYLPFNGFSLIPTSMTIVNPDATYTNTDNFTLTCLIPNQLGTVQLGVINHNINININGEVYTTPLSNMILDKPINMFTLPRVDANVSDSMWSINVVHDGNSVSTTPMFFEGFLLTPITEVPVSAYFYSYNNTSVDYPYRDSYGNTITSSTPISGSVKAGPYLDTIDMAVGSRVFYGLFQGLWQVGDETGSGFTYDSCGYIQLSASASGSYNFYPITNKGHIYLTITVSSSGSASLPATQTFPYIIYPSYPIDITSQVSLSSAQSYTPLYGTNPIAINGTTVTLTTAVSTTIAIGNSIFQITITTPPEVQSINVNSNNSYDIIQLLNLGGQSDGIPLSMYVVTGATHGSEKLQLDLKWNRYDFRSFGRQHHGSQHHHHKHHYSGENQ